MGLPEGWVTQVPAEVSQLDLFSAGLLDPEDRWAITGKEQVKMLGNGVVPQQAAAAVSHLLDAAPAHVRADLGMAA